MALAGYQFVNFAGLIPEPGRGREPSGTRTGTGPELGSKLGPTLGPRPELGLELEPLQCPGYVWLPLLIHRSGVTQSDSMVLCQSSLEI